MNTGQRNTIPPAVYERMYEVLLLTSRRVFPPDTDPATVIKPHVWRNADYVGTVNSQVQAWYGWSINYRPLKKGFKTLYFDLIKNTLSLEVQEKLFGAVFAKAMASFDQVVFLFVTSYPYKSCQTAIDRGFVFRQINDAIHPGCLMDIDQFLDTPIQVWVDKGLALLKLQQELTLSDSVTPLE